MLPLIILAIEDDDDRAFMSEVYLKYERLMYSEAYEVTRHRQDAEDVIHNTIVKLIDNIATLRKLDRPRLVNYICRSARNNAISLCQKERKKDILSINDEAWLEGQFLSTDDPDIESQMIWKEDFDNFQNVWDILDEKTKYLLSEKYLFDKSAKEIAEDLGATPENVRMMLTRARRKVQKMLEKTSA